MCSCPIDEWLSGSDKYIIKISTIRSENEAAVVVADILNRWQVRKNSREPVQIKGKHYDSFEFNFLTRRTDHSILFAGRPASHI